MPWDTKCYSNQIHRAMALGGPMATSGHLQTFGEHSQMSALPSKADVTHRHLCFQPTLDSCTAANKLSFDKLVSAAKKRFRNRQPESLGGLKIDHQREFS